MPCWVPSQPWETRIQTKLWSLAALVSVPWKEDFGTRPHGAVAVDFLRLGGRTTVGPHWAHPRFGFGLWGWPAQCGGCGNQG